MFVFIGRTNNGDGRPYPQHSLITAMNIHSAGVGAGDQRRTQPGSSPEGGRHPAKCRYKLPSGAGLSFLFPLFFSIFVLQV